MVQERLLRNFIFGVEDSLVSTVGFISGIAVAAVERSTLLMAGLVLIFVEAFSMGVGIYLADESVQQMRFHGHATGGRSLVGGFVMFFSYLVSGLLVLVPYAAWKTADALPQSVAISLAMLFLLGAFSARLAGLPILRRGLRMMLIGGLAICLGALVAIAMRGRA
jgi:VIT1/CCC1 family predicted Fe2+/Mn2+ transporter